MPDLWVEDAGVFVEETERNASLAVKVQESHWCCWNCDVVVLYLLFAHMLSGHWVVPVCAWFVHVCIGTDSRKHLSDRAVPISCSAKVDLLSRAFDQSHPWRERLRKPRAWKSWLGTNSKANHPRPWEPASCKAKIMPCWCFVWQPRTCSARQDGDPQWEGIEVSLMLSGTKASSSSG